MKKLTKIAIVAAGAALAVQGAFAQPNSLIFSVDNNDGSGGTEFDVNLGSVSSLVSQGPNYSLSGLVSSFNIGYASATASGLNVGAVAGQNGQGGLSNPGVGNDIFMTTARVGGGSYTTAGTEGAPSVIPNGSTIAAAGALTAGFSDFGPNISTTDSGSFTTEVAKDPSTLGTGSPNWVNDLGGDNPLSTMTGSTITLDLWGDTQTTKGTSGQTSGWVYEGDLTFTVDPTGANAASLVWDAATVPEPSTPSLVAGVGFGLFALTLRRKFRGKNA